MVMDEAYSLCIVELIDEFDEKLNILTTPFQLI